MYKRQATDFDTLTEDSEIDPSDTDESTEVPDSDTPDTEIDESDGEPTSPEKIPQAPSAPTKHPDRPSIEFRAAASAYPEYTGTIHPDQLKRTKCITPGTDPKVKKNLLKDLDEFVLGTRPQPGKKDTLGQTGEPTTSGRRTRTAGPAPEIGPLPKVPIERKPKVARGKPWK